MNYFEKQIAEVGAMNEAEAKKLYNHSQNWDDVDWSEMSNASLKNKIKTWIVEVKSGQFPNFIEWEELDDNGEVVQRVVGVQL